MTTYIISTATCVEHYGIKPYELAEQRISWSARDSFGDVCYEANSIGGSWQVLERFWNEDEARAQWERLKQTMAGCLTRIFKSPMTGDIGYIETAFKLERINDDTDNIDLLDWHAEGFEHEPKIQGAL